MKKRIRTETDRANDRERMRRYRAKGREFVTKLKVEAGCADCGIKHPAVLHFHHIDAEQKLERIAYMVSRRATQEELMEEIKKCVVLCMNCHTIRHWQERQNEE